MSATSGSTSATSGTLGNVPPVSFPGIASGIDYNSIIEKYTADTLQQEKPTQTQINNLTQQNTAILKLQSLIGSVQDSLTALSNPQTFGAYKAVVANTSSGSPAATATQISGQTPVAGTYTINAQTVATATSITNSPTANGALSLTQPLDNAGTSIQATNGGTGNGRITINGVALNYDVTTQTLPQIIAQINSLLQANDGGSATYANGVVTLTGVTSIGSGADIGNLEQVLKLDTAQILPTTLNPAAPLSNESLVTQPIATNVVSSSATLNADNLTTPATAGQIVVNGTAINFNPATDSLNSVLTAIVGVTGGTYQISGNKVTLLGGTLTSLSDASGGNLLEALNLNGTITNNSTTSTAEIISPADVVVNGTTIGYNPATDSLNAILAKITAVTGGTFSISAGNEVTLSGGTLTSLADGSGGNLLEALNLPSGAIAGNTATSSASILNSSTDQLTSSAVISGIDENSVLNQNGNAGFATAVTAGTFTINGVQFTVDPTKNALSDLITEINSSAAGVTATYNSDDSSLTLTSNVAGPQGILLGASGDTSNFLTAAGLTAASGATTVVGTQASLSYTNSTGEHTVYSSTNDFKTAIPGIDLNITASSPSTLPYGSTYYTVNVASDPTQAEAAINTFIKAYNAVIAELNKDTAAPTVTAGTDATTGTSSSTSSGGGVLYNNYQIAGLKDQLVNLVSGFIPSGSTAYNSLQSVGLSLDTNSQTVGATDADSDSSTTSSSSTNDSSFTVNATSGELAALDTTQFEAAYAANTSAVQNLFTLLPTLNGTEAGAQPVPGSNYGFSYLLGSTLANTDGLATFLTNSVVTPDNLSYVLLTSITDNNNQQIDSLQEQITIINNEATQQADQLREQFTASESQIAELQALQSQIAAIGH